MKTKIVKELIQALKDAAFDISEAACSCVDPNTQHKPKNCAGARKAAEIEKVVAKAERLLKRDSGA